MITVHHTWAARPEGTPADELCWSAAPARSVLQDRSRRGRRSHNPGRGFLLVRVVLDHRCFLLTELSHVMT